MEKYFDRLYNDHKNNIDIRGYLFKELYLKLRLSDTISLIFIYLQPFTKEKIF